uniref:Uncharacterized protein n=1 Tax=Arundo donax TaxID=35708 RepID=A0A0A9BBE3_ARUDO
MAGFGYLILESQDVPWKRFFFTLLHCYNNVAGNISDKARRGELLELGMISSGPVQVTCSPHAFAQFTWARSCGQVWFSQRMAHSHYLLDRMSTWTVRSHMHPNKLTGHLQSSHVLTVAILVSCLLA